MQICFLKRLLYHKPLHYKCMKDCTHSVWRVVIGDVECIHCTNHSMHGHEDVLVDYFDKAAFVIIWVARAMDDAHLFDECALARFSSPWEQRQSTMSHIWFQIYWMFYPSLKAVHKKVHTNLLCLIFSTNINMHC